MTTTLKDGRGLGLRLDPVIYAAAIEKDKAVADASAKVPSLVLYDLFVSPELAFLGGITAGQVVDALATVADAPEIEVRLNSPGGDLWAGVAVYNALTRFPGKVTVHIDGMAASVASLVALAGDETLVAENGMVMVHRPWTVMAGDAEEMRQMSAILDKGWSAMLVTYAARTGKRGPTIEQKVAEGGGEWWMTADEAVAAGFADKTEKAEKAPAVFGLSRFTKVPERLAASAKDAAPLPLPTMPKVAEIAAPRVSKEADGSAATRRRQMEVLRLSD